MAHGGIEMGQGLHTKMIQVCASTLGIPISMIYINETSTATVANTTASAASMSSDIYGMAILNACDVLNGRLAPVKKNNPSLSWEEWVSLKMFKFTLVRKNTRGMSKLFAFSKFVLACATEVL